MNNTGGIIVAAGNTNDNGRVSPLFEIGSISIIKRIILTFQKAKISPIVVITGYQSLEVEQHLSDYEVIFLKNENYDSADKFDSAKIGLNFLKDKCKQVIFTSATIPMYTSSTLNKLIKTNKQLIVPSYRGRAGHPLLINCDLINKIVEYSGKSGMREAINNIGIKKEYLEVEDRGIILEAYETEELNGVVQYYNDKLLHPFIRISIEKESLFFNARAKLLLLLIKETHSVKRACKHMALSYGKAWSMLNEMEKSLGYNVVERRHGGSKGGKTSLTLEGEDFLSKYQKYEEDIRQYASKHFYDIFENVK